MNKLFLKPDNVRGVPIAFIFMYCSTKVKIFGWMFTIDSDLAQNEYFSHFLCSHNRDH